jgi:hypothetical protein
MELLERGAFLESLESWLAAARNGEGCMVVLLGGEAGRGAGAPGLAEPTRHRLFAAFLDLLGPADLYSGTNRYQFSKQL